MLGLKMRAEESFRTCRAAEHMLPECPFLESYLRMSSAETRGQTEEEQHTGDGTYDIESKGIARVMVIQRPGQAGRGCHCHVLCHNTALLTG